MNTIRHANHFDAGMSATGFWLGLTMGRVTLGFITPRIGERLAVSIYLLLSLALELLFWLVPNYMVSTVMVSLLGFFLGPLFPAAIVAATRVLPKHLHVSGVGFAASVGGGGAAIVPFVTGVIVDVRGVDKLQPIVLALVAVMLGLWMLLPRFPAVSEAAGATSKESGIASLGKKLMGLKRSG
jgi:fucose permease